MKKLNAALIACFWLCMLIFPLPLSATGPSFAEIKIVPLAANAKGIIIFKTFVHINKSGAHTLEGREYGWLCASATGLWEERLHYRLSAEDSMDGRRIKFFDDEFNNRKDLSNPPESLQSLMAMYDFKNWEVLDPNEGKGKVIWSPKNICKNGKCTDHGIAQKTLNGHQSDTRNGSAVKSSFYYRGLVLFNNIEPSYNDESVKKAGAEFSSICLKLYGEYGVLDYFEIIGVCIVPF